MPSAASAADAGRCAGMVRLPGLLIRSAAPGRTANCSSVLSGFPSESAAEAADGTLKRAPQDLSAVTFGETASGAIWVVCRERSRASSPGSPLNRRLKRAPQDLSAVTFGDAVGAICFAAAVCRERSRGRGGRRRFPSLCPVSNLPWRNRARRCASPVSDHGGVWDEAAG